MGGSGGGSGTTRLSTYACARVSLLWSTILISDEIDRIVS